MNIEELARKAGFQWSDLKDQAWCASTSDLVRFAELLLEQAAQKCDDLPVPESCSRSEKSLWDVATMAAGDAIRAMKP